MQMNCSSVEVSSVFFGYQNFSFLSWLTFILYLFCGFFMENEMICFVFLFYS